MEFRGLHPLAGLVRGRWSRKYHLRFFISVMESEATSSGHRPGFVDRRSTKERIARVLPPGHPVRELLLQELDFIPEDEAVVKFGTLTRLLFLTEGQT